MFLITTRDNYIYYQIGDLLSVFVCSFNDASLLFKWPIDVTYTQFYRFRRFNEEYNFLSIPVQQAVDNRYYSGSH